MFQRTAEGPLIRVFHVGTDGESMGEASDVDADRLKDSREVRGGGFAFKVGVGCEDDLGDIGGAQSLKQFANFELLRTDAIHGAEGTVEDVIATVETSSALDGENIERLFNDADG